jgi:hypothetical protein
VAYERVKPTYFAWRWVEIVVVAES